MSFEYFDGGDVMETAKVKVPLWWRSLVALCRFLLGG